MMISLAILSIGTITGMAFYSQSKKSLNDMGHVTVMRTIAKSVETALQNSDVILFSAQNAFNVELLNCIISDMENDQGQVDINKKQVLTSVTKVEVISDDARTCTQTDPKKQSPILVIKPPKDWKMVADTDDFVAQYAVAGGIGESVIKYDHKGRRRSGDYCKLKKTNCPFEARAWFWAFCPRSARDIRTAVRGSSDFASIGIPSECDRAQSVNFRYQITHNKDSVTSKTTRMFTRKLPSIPRDDQFWDKGIEHWKAGSTDHTTYSAIAHDVSQLGRFSEYIGICKTNFTLVAIEDSKPICRCLPPYKLYNRNSRKNSYCDLEKHFCRPDQRYMGTRLDGTAVCQPVDCSDVKEYDIEAGQTISFDCTADKNGVTRLGWLWKIEIESTSGSCECNESKNTKVSGSNDIEFECPLKCRLYRTCCFEQ